MKKQALVIIFIVVLASALIMAGCAKEPVQQDAGGDAESSQEDVDTEVSNLNASSDDIGADSDLDNLDEEIDSLDW